MLMDMSTSYCWTWYIVAWRINDRVVRCVPLSSCTFIKNVELMVNSMMVALAFIPQLKLVQHEKEYI